MTIACADYLTAKKEYLDFATPSPRLADRHRRHRGAARRLVKDRMDITGARWGFQGAQAILKLRALIANGDFDQY